MIVANLKPCPFCSGIAQVRQRKTAIVECASCRALFIRMTVRAAVSAWNKRAAAQTVEVAGRLI